MCKTTDCSSCISYMKQDLAIPQPRLPSGDEVTETFSRERERFLDQVNRGGLTYPSDPLYFLSVHAWGFYFVVMSNEEAEKFIFSCGSPRNVFLVAQDILLSFRPDTKLLLDFKCTYKHSFHELGRQLAGKMFNMCAKNACNDRNSFIHSGRKRGPATKTQAGKKVAKLQSKNEL